MGISTGRTGCKSLFVVAAVCATPLTEAHAQYVILDGTNSTSVGVLIAPGEIIRPVNGSWVAILPPPNVGASAVSPKPVSTGGFMRYDPHEVGLAYLSTDCTGQPYMGTSTDTPLLGYIVAKTQQDVGKYGVSGMLYYAGSPQIFVWGSGNTVAGGVCQTNVNHFAMRGGPATHVDISTWKLKLPFKMLPPNPTP